MLKIFLCLWCGGLDLGDSLMDGLGHVVNVTGCHAAH